MAEEEKKKPRAERMYGKGPRIVDAEPEKGPAKRDEGPKGEVDTGTDGVPTDRETPDDGSAMRDAHMQELKDANTRHEKERRDMNARHEQELRSIHHRHGRERGKSEGRSGTEK